LIRETEAEPDLFNTDQTFSVSSNVLHDAKMNFISSCWSSYMLRAIESLQKNCSIHMDHFLISLLTFGASKL